MIPYFLLGLALLIALFFFGRWFATANPKDVIKAIRWVFSLAAIAFGIALLIYGTSLLIPLLTFLVPVLLLRGGPIWRRIKAASGPTPGQSSGISTRFFNMTLDHDSGAMNGEVLEGRFAGRWLEQMHLAELIELLKECHAADADSASVLEAYLDRMHGEDWRDGDSGGSGRKGDAGSGGTGSGAMTLEEAYAVLGLQEGASPDQIREAHRGLMQKNHPDRGGSNYLAAKINQAKALLLGE